jgi:DNA topoisomerase-1
LEILVGRVEFILLPKDLGEYKRFRSVMVVMVLTFVMELLLCLCQRRNPLDVDFERAKELIDEKAILMLLQSIKERCSEKCWPFWSFIKWNGLFINVSKKYDFDNLSQADIETLIEDKLQKKY